MTNIIDRAFEYFSPKVALSREQSRHAIAVVRGYSAANPHRLNEGFRKSSSHAATEVSKAHAKLAGGAQELVRNNSVALRIKTVLANNMVGTGVTHEYTFGAKRSGKKYKDVHTAWANSTECDFEGHNNLYGLQWLWAATIVESGGVLVKKVIDNTREFPLVLQTLEQQYLDKSKALLRGDEGEVIDGIQYDKNQKVIGYWIKKRLQPSIHYKSEDSVFVPKEDVVFAFFKDRPGQHLGVSWLAPVMDLIYERNDWREAALTQQRIAASLGIIVSESPNTLGLSGGKDNTGLRDSDGNQFDTLEPGMVAYTSSNTKIDTVSPPKADNASALSTELSGDISIGVGMTREQITGDYSKVTWASGRLARGEFYSNLDRWQTFMLSPPFERIHAWFDELYSVKHGVVPKYTKTVVWPLRSAVNPVEELDVDIKKVRTAAMTPQQFSMKHGVKFEEVIEAWREAKDAFGEDLPFDHDPSKFSAAGNQLDDNDAASSNKVGDEKNDSDTDDDKK